MSFRTTAGMFAVVVAVLVGLIIYYSNGNPIPADGLMAPLIASGYKTEDVTTLELVRTQPSEQKLVFQKQNGIWTLADSPGTRVDGNKIRAVVNALFGAKIVPYPGLTRNLTVHGLDKPTLKLTARTKDNKSASVNVGETTIGGQDSVTFVTLGEKPDVPIAVRANDLRALFQDGPREGAAYKTARWLTDYRMQRLLAANLDNLDAGIKSLRLTQGKSELALTYNQDFTWSFELPQGYGVADTLGESETRPDAITGVRPLINLVANLQAGTNADFLENVTPADYAQYGLNSQDPAVIRVELLPREGAREVLYIGKPVEENGKPVSPARYYCRLEGDNAIVKVQTNRIDSLAKLIADPSDLRNRDLIAEIKKPRIDAIDFKSEGQSFKLRKLSSQKEAVWVVYGGSEPRYANPLIMENLLSTLTKPRAAAEVLPGKQDEAYNPQTGEVHVWLDGVGIALLPPDGKLPPEPPTQGEPIVFQLGSADANLTHLRRVVAGVTTAYRVPNLTAATLKRPRLDFIDPRVPSFSITQATRLRFNRGADQYDFNKIALTDPLNPTGRWAFASPVARKDQSADTSRLDALLSFVASTQGARLVAEGVSNEQLIAWGLNPAQPQMRVTVNLQDSPTPERTFDFGNILEGGREVFYKVGGEPFVFALNKAIYDQFAGMDLRDRILYRIKKDDVYHVDFKGWKGMAAEPLTLAVARTDTGWKAQNPATFALKTDALEQLLKNLENPRIQDFVDTIPPADVHGLDVAAGALEIVLHLKGKPGILLKFGKRDSTGQSLYVETSAAPGQILKLSASEFGMFVESRENLGK